MSASFVICIVLNHNRRQDTLECLRSLCASSYRNFQTLVLNDQPNDGTLELIQGSYPYALVVDLQQNKGYAGNNNFGIDMARDRHADWVFILNEDTLLDSHCMAELVQAGESSSEAGFIGPTIYHFDEPGVIQSGGGTLGKYWKSGHIEKDKPDTGQLQTTRPVEWISGCAMLVRMKMIKEIGLLDEDFFAYWEETDWCIRARKAGWKVLQVPSAKLWHKGVQRNYNPPPSVTYYLTRNRFLLLQKQHAPLIAWLCAFGETFRTLLSWSVHPKWREKQAHRDAMWQGLLDFYEGRWGRQTVE